MTSPTRHLATVGQHGGDDTLAVVRERAAIGCSGAPGEGRAIVFESQSMESACGNAHDVTYTSRDIGLAVSAGAPNDQATIGLQGDAVG